MTLSKETGEFLQSANDYVSRMNNILGQGIERGPDVEEVPIDHIIDIPWQGLLLLALTENFVSNLTQKPQVPVSDSESSSMNSWIQSLRKGLSL